MGLSVGDETTLVELGVIALGVVVTWLVYRRSAPEDAAAGPGTIEASGPETPREDRSAIE